MKGLRRIHFCDRKVYWKFTHIYVFCETKILGNANCHRSGLKQFFSFIELLSLSLHRKIIWYKLGKSLDHVVFLLSGHSFESPS